MTKKLFIIFLTLCLAITAMTVVTCAETVSGNGWSLDTETGELIIDDTMGSYYWANTGRVTYGSLVVTATIKSGNSVEAATFERCYNLVSVSLPNGLQTICDRAFNGCSSLTSIEIPSSVTSIQGNAFYGTRISSVTISCAATYESDAFPEGTTINRYPHTYSNGTCTICNTVDPDYVMVGSAELHSGYYTVDGLSAVYGTPDSTVTSYARYSGGVLYLKNFTYAPTSGTYGIYSENDSLTIDLCEGTSSLSGVTSGIYALGDLTVTNGSLTVSAEYGISINGDILISDCTSVTVLATGVYGIVARNYDDSNHSVTISDSTVNVTATTANGGSMAGILATGDVNISGSTVSVTVDCESVMGAIWSMGGNISITDESTVIAEATAETYSGGAISTTWSETGNITISKSEVTASSVCTSTVYETVNYGAIYASGDISITESEVTASTNGGVFSDVANYGAAICSEKESILISGSDINATVDSSSNYYAVNNDYDTAVAIFSLKNVVISDESEVTINIVAVFNSFGILAVGNSTISESAVSVESEGAVTYGILISNSLVIEDCDNVSVTVSGSSFIAGVCGDATITGSSVNVKASATGSSGAVYGIWSANSATITASEIVADGGIYLTSSTGTVTVTPADGGSLKITKTNASATDISIIDEATVISTSGYTYVAITEHVHAYDYDKIAWTWTDYQNVTAAVTCTDTDCDHAVTVTATVESETTPATCTADGEIVYTATAVFGTTEYTDTASETIAATGHSYEAVVTAPTCTEKGYTTHTCSVCGDTYTDSETEPTGHTHLFTGFTWASDLLSANAVYTCHCGDTVTAEATVTMQGDNGVYTMTATITDSDGTVHTDTQTAGVSLSTIAADYTSVNDAIAKANALNAASYSNFDTVTSAIDKVQWNLSVVNQETVNNYAEAIETAIANLIPVTVEETVNIDEPIEDTDTEVEPDEAEAETPVEENPTTGAVVALLPMAIAMAGAIAAKKRLG